jgi:hypothetical protein
MVKWINLDKPQRARLLPILRAGCLSLIFFLGSPCDADTTATQTPEPNQNLPASQSDKQHNTLDAVINDACLKDTDQIVINSRGIIDSSSHCDKK